MNEDKIAPELNEADKIQKQKETIQQYEQRVVELVNKDFKNARDYVKKFKQTTWDNCWSVVSYFCSVQKMIKLW